MKFPPPTPYERLLRKVQRERRARHEAERLLDDKSLEIFRINEELLSSNAELDRRVAMRTQELENARHRLEMVMHASGAALWEWDVENNEYHFSRQLLESLDYEPDVLARMLRTHHLVHPAEKRRLEKAVKRHLATRKPIDIEFRLRLADGRYRWYRLVGDSEWSEDGERPTHFAASLTDIDDRMRGEAVIERLSKHDVLTDIPNRLRFTEELEQAIAEADGDDQRIALLVLNLNDFKSINDSFGYAVGDAVLKQVAEVLQHSVKGFDVAARLGGDEFGIILKRIEQKDHVATICRKILGALRDARHGALRDHRITACIGVTAYPGDGVSPHELLMRTDFALLKARQQRQQEGAFAFYDPEQDQEPRYRRRLEQHLEEALENEQFCIDYQPEATLPERRIIAAEALLRWQHPERGRLAPGDFIAAAESSGLVMEIGEWVIHQVCRDLQQWLQVSDQARVAVNLSPVQMAHGDVAGTIAAALDRHHIPAECMEVEVTENVLLHDLDRARDVLNRLHEMGVWISLDDFGSGYSSLAYLQQLPIDKVKIDRVFISRMARDSNSRIITETIIRLAHSLNLQVLAEGVETQRQAELLHELGCDFMQGFLLARPQPFADFLSALDLRERHQSVRMRPSLREV
ncbi:MAG: GGDEF and EAL domain-containing protein [Gammaproteobacteria bacterium]|nr:GGDEF and EAL domain-containing protein [Gammaproteobacteria bacterium]